MRRPHALRGCLGLTAALLLCGSATAALATSGANPGAVAAKVSAPPQVSSDTPNIAVKQFTLPNGLTALVYTDHVAPSVYVGIRYRIGSRDEPAGRTGFAHLFEHLMFQSTTNRKGDLLSVLTSAGADDVNGMTTTDWTEYHETVPTNALDLALWLESDRMSNLAGGITQTELDEQRGVVENEKRQGELGPGAHGTERYLAGYYPAGHPYAHETIGSMEDIDKASLDDVKQWFTDYYGAGNAVIVLAGDIDFDTARAKVEHYFGGVRPGKPVDRMLQWLPSFSEIKRDRVYEQVGAASITRSWPIPNDDLRTLTLLQLAARTMAGGRNSLLNQRLVHDRQIADGVSADLSESQLGSTFSISIGVHPGVSVAEAGQALDKALAEFLRIGPARERLDAIVTASDTQLLNLMESAPTIGSWALAGKVDHDDPTYFLQQRNWIAAATPAETRATAAKWLSRPYYELQTLPAPRLTAAPDAVDRSHLPVPGKLDIHLTFPAIETAQLDNGLKIVVAPRHNLPLIQASLEFATGSLAETPVDSGIAHHAFDLLGAGTQHYDASALATQLAHLGTGMSTSTQGRTSAMRWSTTTSRLEPSMALVAEIIRHPAYPQDRIDRINQAQATDLDQNERNPAGSADRLLRHALFGTAHPFGHIVPRAQSHKLAREELVAFHDTHVTPANATLYLVGDITLAQAKALVQKDFGDWKAPAPAPIPPLPAPAPAADRPRVILVDSPGAQQSTIVAGELVAPFDADQSATEALMNAVLGGAFDSRLNTDLRQTKGWAYNFGSSIDGDANDARVFSVGGNVQADKTAASLAEVRDQLSAFVSQAPITAQELDRQRTATIEALPASYATNGAILNAITSATVLGLPYDRAASTAERLSAVDLDSARMLASRLLHPNDLTWIVVGDLKSIEAPVRALGLGPVEVWDVYGHRLR